MNVIPTDPLTEDASVLALFDALIEEGERESDFFYTSSSDDDEEEESSDDLYQMEDERRLRRVLRGLPFFRHGLHFFGEDSDGDGTPTDSELSVANTSSLEPPWSSEDDTDGVMYWSDRADWGSSEDDVVYWSDREDRDSGDSGSDSSVSEEKDGRVERISHHHDDEKRGSDKAKETDRRSGAKDRTLKTEGASSSQSKEECESASKSGAQSQPTRCQPSRKTKKTVAAGPSEGNRSTSAAERRRDSSSVAGNHQPKPKKDEGGKISNSKKCQPKRKVKSASASQSAVTSCHDEAMNSEPSACSSSSPMVKPSKGGSETRAVANGNGETSSSGRGSRDVANGNGETTSDSGPSQWWIRKRNRRQREANGTAADNYQQYRVEDFLKAKSPTSFYTKKKDPP